MSTSPRRQCPLCDRWQIVNVTGHLRAHRTKLGLDCYGHRMYVDDAAWTLAVEV